MKRNDVHYLLKQLNSFSDIEEIEIVDMKHRQQQQQEQQQQQQLAVNAHLEKRSPTAQSLVLVSPSTLSHKGIRRYASLHQTHEKTVAPTTSLSQQLPSTTKTTSTTTTAATAALAAGGAAAAAAAQLLQQFDDYIFQSCHYLETNYFAANYRTAMVESSSHEFRPSTTTGTSASYSSHSSLHTYDLHETEPPSVICNAPIHAQQPPALAPPVRRFQMQARLTSSGVQTELTASSLSTAATSASLAKSATSHNTSNSSSSSEAVRCRRKPFFKCCYTPIDRWRERRTAAAAAAAATEKQRSAETSKQAEASGGGAI